MPELKNYLVRYSVEVKMQKASLATYEHVLLACGTDEEDVRQYVTEFLAGCPVLLGAVDLPDKGRGQAVASVGRGFTGDKTVEILSISEE